MIPFRCASAIADRNAPRLLFASRRRHHSRNERNRRFFEHARRLAGSRILDDQAVLRVGRVTRDTRPLECRRVHPRRVAVRREQLNRTILHDRVELLARRQFVGKRREVPTASEDPGFVRVLLGPRVDTLLDLGKRHRVRQVDPLEIEAAFDEVQVGVVESRQHASAMRIDHRRLRAPQAHHVAFAADAQDLIAADRHGLGGGVVLVGRVDHRVVDDHIHRTFAVVPLRTHDEAGNEGRSNDSDDDERSEAGRH